MSRSFVRLEKLISYLERLGSARFFMNQTFPPFSPFKQVGENRADTSRSKIVFTLADYKERKYKNFNISYPVRIIWPVPTYILLEFVVWPHHLSGQKIYKVPETQILI